MLLQCFFYIIRVYTCLGIGGQFQYLQPYALCEAQYTKVHRALHSYGITGLSNGHQAVRDSIHAASGGYQLIGLQVAAPVHRPARHLAAQHIIALYLLVRCAVGRQVAQGLHHSLVQLGQW